MKYGKSKLTPSLVIIIIVGIFVGSALLNKFTNLNLSFKGEAQKQEQSPIEGKKISTKCTRTSRLENPPEIERALSLIEQRSPKTVAGGFSDVLNCVVIEYRDIKNTTGAEGYFLFDEKSATANYLPIYIDLTYKETDDIVASVLLSHEMVHAGQYLNRLQGNQELSCMDKEVVAFMTQYFYTQALNEGEQKSITARILQDDDQPQLEILWSLIDLSANTMRSCGLKGHDQCWFQGFKKGVESMVNSSRDYQKQCASQ